MALMPNPTVDQDRIERWNVGGTAASFFHLGRALVGRTPLGTLVLKPDRNQS
jgi:hypothetical protein